MCFDREEYEERKETKDSFITGVLSDEKMMLKGSENALWWIREQIRFVVNNKDPQKNLRVDIKGK